MNATVKRTSSQSYGDISVTACRYSLSMGKGYRIFVFRIWCQDVLAQVSSSWHCGCCVRVGILFCGFTRCVGYNPRSKRGSAGEGWGARREGWGNCEGFASACSTNAVAFCGSCWQFSPQAGLSYKIQHEFCLCVKIGWFWSVFIGSLHIKLERSKADEEALIVYQRS